MRLENDWSILSEPDEGLLWFYNQLVDICRKHVSRRKKSVNEKKNPKIPYHCRKQWKRLQKLYKKLKLVNTQVKVTAIHLEIKHIQSSLIEENETRDRESEKKAKMQIKKTPKLFM